VQHLPSLPDPGRTSQRLLNKIGNEGIPVDVYAVSKIWENLSILEESIDGPGYLLPLGKLGAEIIVRQADPVERRRFTIAHEVGHWVLGITCEQKTGEFRQPTGVRSDLVEKWCDAFAASFLIPSNRLIEYFTGVDDFVLVRHILNAPKRFRVSEETMFLRTYEVLGIRIVYVQCDSSSPRITRSFVPRELVPEIETVIASPDVRELLWSEGFSSRMKVGVADFLCCWSRLPDSSKNILVLNPCGEVRESRQ
jgi:hypothetical protein